MVRRVILHIGLHHTGTTSFQVFLKRNHEYLRSKGFLVYKPLNQGINSAELHGAIREAADACQVRAIQRNIFKHCTEYEAHSLIVSAESLSLLRGRGEVSRLRTLFPEHELDFHVLVVLRDKDEWMQRDQGRRPTDWNNMIEGYSAVFGSVQTINYKKDNAVADLCRSIGMPIHSLNTNIRYHRSSAFKAILQNKAPIILNLYKQYLAKTFVGKSKRWLLNR